MRMPDGWVIKPLSDIARVTSGGTPSRTKPEYWENGSVPWIRTTEVQNCILTPQHAQEYISEKGVQKSSAKLVPSGTILLAMIGQGKTRGQVALLRFQATTNQNCAAIILNDDQEPDFHFNYLLSQYKSIRRMSNAAGQSNLSGALVKSIRVPVPPRSEQRKIAKILSAWDQAIATTDRLLANSEQQKKFLMQQLLTGNKRLPGFDGKWKHYKISDISTRIQRQSGGGDYPILMMASKSGFVSQDKKYSRYMAGESVNKYILLKKGEFAYNKGNSLTYQFGCVFELQEYSVGLVPNVYVCFKLRKGLSNRFYRHLFEADYLKPQLGRVVNTGVRNNGLLNIKPSEFLKATVPVPSASEQERIADILDAATSTVEGLKGSLKRLKDEKRALMQQLLTGKRRVRTEEVA